MIENVVENNRVELVGKISSGLSFSHEVYGEKFYKFQMDIPRLSDYNDVIPVAISERLLVDIDFAEGTLIKVVGQFRSYNSYEDNRSRLVLIVFARDVEILTSADDIRDPNQIMLNGYICKRPIHRSTPFGREIADILIAVNRQYNKSDYIPCITWGRNARYCKSLDVGDNIKIWGRVQSRVYQKKLDDETTVDKVAYEISVTKMEIDEDKRQEILAKEREENMKNAVADNNDQDVG